MTGAAYVVVAFVSKRCVTQTSKKTEMGLSYYLCFCPCLCRKKVLGRQVRIVFSFN